MQTKSIEWTINKINLWFHLFVIMTVLFQGFMNKVLTRELRMNEIETKSKNSEISALQFES